MRCKNIKFTYEIPVPVDSPDENGVVYKEQAIIDSVPKIVGVPLTDKAGDSVLGVVSAASYKDGVLTVSGMARFGGTCENVTMDEFKNITEMLVTEISLST